MVVVGVYDDGGGEPGALLGTGRSRTLADGERNSIPVTLVALQAGERYWLALLSPKRSGTIRFRDLPTGSGGATKVSAQTDLTATCGLPPDWHSGGDFANSPASAYLS